MLRCATETMLFAIGGLVILTGFCNADLVAVRCSNKTGTSLRPSADGVQGRYELEWCSNASANDDQWAFEIVYNRKHLNRCSIRDRDKHSASVVNLNKEMPDCKNVCLIYSPVDLIFNACYTVNQWFPSRGTWKDISYLNITNGLTMDRFTKSKFTATLVDHVNYVSIHYFTGTIPVTMYDVELTKKNASDNQIAVWRKAVTNQCKHSLYEIVCELKVSEGNYTSTVTLNAPWVRGHHNIMTNFYKTFSIGPSGDGPVVSPHDTGARAAMWWVCGVLVALCAAALLLVAVLRCRRATAVRKHVLREWLHRVENKSVIETPAPAPTAAGPILLLYAREGPRCEPVIEALKELLETVAPGQVYDIGSASTLALAAAGGGEWVRGMMARRDARVVLLQTPALRALHRPRLADTDPPKLEQPLLSSRLVYAAPAAGDWLLLFALRLLADSAHQPPGAAPPYRKYYLATLSGLETEALPFAVPFRRYVLPPHALALARDLAPAARAAHHVAPRALDALAAAAGDFVDHVRAHPDYLAHELRAL